jgi:FkbM family methyltransferase
VLKDIVAIAPHGQHIAFEPLPELAERLRVKFPGVTVVQQAVSDRVGQSTFQHVTNSPAYSGLQRRVYDRAVEIEEITVERVRLDDVIRQDLEVALIKLDIEGGEYDALKGGVDTIRRCRPILVFEASIGSTGAYGVEPDALYFLITQTLGYRLATMSDWFRGIPGYDQATFRQNWYDGPEFYFIAYP